MFKKKKEKELISVYHYNIQFKTSDYNVHNYSKMAYIDKSQIDCTPLEYYLQDAKYLFDDKGRIFPISSMIWIAVESEEKIDSVVKEYDNWDLPKVWYPSITKEEINE